MTAGACIIAADQAGNANYNLAPQAKQSFDIGKANQTISFGEVPTVIVGSTGVVSATGGSSGNPVAFTSATPSVCTVSGSKVTGVTAGTCTIAADQAGNANYNAAAQAVLSFSVTLNQLASSTECLFNWAERTHSDLFAPADVTKVGSNYTYRYYAGTNAYLGVSSTDQHVVYMGADGVMHDEGALSDWLPKAGCGAPKLPPSECLFNWAEQNYPTLFAPSGTTTATLGVYSYRHYSGTQTYLGVSSANNDVYYMGADGALLDVGPMSTWLTLAGCQ